MGSDCTEDALAGRPGPPALPDPQPHPRRRDGQERALTTQDRHDRSGENAGISHCHQPPEDDRDPGDEGLVDRSRGDRVAAKDVGVEREQPDAEQRRGRAQAQPAADIDHHRQRHDHEEGEHDAKGSVGTDPEELTGRAQHPGDGEPLRERRPDVDVGEPGRGGRDALVGLCVQSIRGPDPWSHPYQWFVAARNRSIAPTPATTERAAERCAVVGRGRRSRGPLSPRFIYFPDAARAPRDRGPGRSPACTRLLDGELRGAP